MPAMTIGALSRASGTHVETIRFYQSRGLVPVPRRPKGGIRRYGPETVARLRFVKRAQDIGFTLQEIAELLALEHGGRNAHSLAEAKLTTVERRIADLLRVRQTLRELLARCEAGGSRGCPIIEALEQGE